MAKLNKTPNKGKTSSKAKKQTSTITQAATAHDPQGEGIKEKNKGGRPSGLTAEIAEMVCEGVASGKSTRVMCLTAGISQSMLWRWLDKVDWFREQYARAKERCADVYAEEIIEIADDSIGDMRMDKSGNKVVDQEVVARARLRIDARKWYASKVAPKRYGERVTQELQGLDGRPVQLPPPDYDRIRELAGRHAARIAG